MRLFGFEVTRTTKAAAPAGMPLRPITPRSGGWWPIVREPWTGAWQSNQEIRWDSALSYFAVYGCVSLIAADIAKLTLQLVQQDADGIWQATTSPAFSPVLRQPNHYQTPFTFMQSWMTSKLIHGNTYVLKERDQRGVVRALYVLDPTFVWPLIAPDGSIFYQVNRSPFVGPIVANVIAGFPSFPIENYPTASFPEGRVVVPAEEIIHDVMVPLFHPLIGVSPVFACGLSALQGLAIQQNGAKFFGNSSLPGGVLTAPGAIADETAQRLKAYWDSNFSGDNVGRVAVLGDGLKYEPMAVNAVDAQLIEQLKWTGETVCSCYHVPPYMIGIGPPPPYANIEPLLQQYYSQCVQALVTACEQVLDRGLELPSGMGTEFDIDDLIWMDTQTKTKAAADGIGAGALTPDEARRKYFGLGPVTGGDTPYMQQQYFSLSALAERDQSDPFAKPAPAAPATPAEPVPEPATKAWTTADLRAAVKACQGGVRAA